MKDIINQIDPFAFITISEAHEILGEGFTLDKKNNPLTVIEKIRLNFHLALFSLYDFP